jgi:filamentous hemagglutinin family protein
MKSWQLWLFASTLMICAVQASNALAQISPDGTTSSTAIKGDCATNCSITGGTKAGSNLFHSFREFNVGQGATVLFSAPDTSNIFSRVTGGELSKIFGTLGVSGGNANLFLINPNGILFGAGAKLDLRGSFVATTANGINFGDRGFFSALPESGENLNLLTVNPSAFLVNQIAPSNSPAKITLDSGAFLSVLPQQNIVILEGTGGGIIFNGAVLQAPTGNIELAAVAEPEIIDTDSNFHLTVPPGIAKADIFFSNSAAIDVSGEGAGNIAISGGNVRLDSGAKILANTLGNIDGGSLNFQVDQLNIFNNAVVSAFAGGTGRGANISIEATKAINLTGISFEFLQLSLLNSFNGTLRPDSLLGGIFTGTASTGTAGNIDINTQKLTLDRGGFIITPTLGAGTSGNLTLTASDGMEINGSVLTTSAIFGTTGNTGNITIETGQLIVRNGGFIATSTLGQGSGGNLTIKAADTVEIVDTPIGVILPSGVFTNALFGSGKAGDLIVETQKLFLRDGGQVSSASGGITGQGTIFVGGQGGNLFVNASDSVEVTGESADVFFPSRIFSDTFTASDAGTLTINTGKLTIDGQALISASALDTGKGGDLTVRASESVNITGIGFELFQQQVFDGFFEELSTNDFRGGIFTITASPAQAGDITIETQRLILQDGAAISGTTLALGNGGNLFIRAADFVEVIGSSINSASLGSGKSGEINIDTRKLIVRDSAFLTTATIGTGLGGNLTVNASESIELLRTPTQPLIPTGIFTNTFNQAGKAGDLIVNTQRLNVQGGAFLSTQSGFRTNLGSITIGGQGGDLDVNAWESIEISGISEDASLSSTLTTATLTESDAGDLTIDTNSLIVKDGGQIAVNSVGSGSAGNLNINADSIELQNQGKLNATTPSGQGGNIFLDAGNLLFLRDRGEISTTATGIGNGGNMTINVKYLVALENSEIIANAVRGRGGNINISTQGLFLSTKSQITASSELGIDGVVEISTPEVEPSRSLVRLPESVVNVAGLIAQSCSNNSDMAKGKFVITGRGGLPANPNKTIDNTNILVDLGNPSNSGGERGRGREGAGERGSAGEKNNHLISDSTSVPLIEARGWSIEDNGKVILTAEATDSSIYQSGFNNIACH